eukprot:3215688-Rhodomonas_salina.1
MQASVPEDMAGIKSLILQEFGSVQQFNESLKQYVKVVAFNSAWWNDDPRPTWGGDDGYSSGGYGGGGGGG